MPLAVSADRVVSAGARSMTKRWLVVIVRLPRTAPESVRGPLGRGIRRRGGAEVPAVVHQGSDPVAANRLAEELRGVGAEVVVVEEANGGQALCGTHPPQLTAEDCIRCQAPICPGCRLEAGGAQLCLRCFREATQRASRGRLRQLFAVFVFAVFVYELWEFSRREQELLDPAGPVDVAIYQFVQPEAAAAPLIRELNALDPTTSLRSIASWYTREHARYTGDLSAYLNLSVYGPWPLATAPPALAEPDDPWWRIMLQSWQYPRYFHALARAHGHDPDARGARVYVIYGVERGDLAADSRGSRSGRIAVSFIPVNSASLAYAKVTVAHELGHVLGARDLYDPDTYLARYPEGYVQPFADPLFPQRYAEVMAVDVPYSPTDEREIRSLEDARVGYRTAAEMGWISPEQADLYYAPQGVSPETMLGPPPPPDAPEPPVDPAPPGPAATGSP